jgi:hypothetical protein
MTTAIAYAARIPSLIAEAIYVATLRRTLRGIQRLA